MTLDGLVRTFRYVRHGLPLLRLKPGVPFSIADLIEKQAVARANHPFVRFEDSVQTYAEFNAKASRVAHWAARTGLHQGDVVALLMENRPAYLEIWAGLAKTGVTTALLNTHVTGEGLRHAIASAGARRLIVGTECLPSLSSIGDEIPEDLDVLVSCERGDAERADLFPARAGDLERELSGSPTVNPDRALRSRVTAGDDLFYIYTSGTTGLPKAARFTHLRMMSAATPALLGGLGARDTMYCALPLYHSAGGAMAVGAVLRAGGTLALRRRFSATHFWEDIRRYDATAFQYIGEFCRYLLNRPEAGGERSHNLRFAIGNGLRPDIWEAFRDRFGIPRIVEFYAATEGNVAAINLTNTVGSVGQLPLRVLMDARIIRYDVETDVHERDERGFCVECRPGEIGEMIGRIKAGVGRFDGYTSDEDTERKILRDVLATGDAFFRTGDLLRADERGELYFIDRIGDTFRWKGENVSTQEVGEAIGAFPGVEMANVYGVEVEGADGRAGMAALNLVEPDTFDGAAFYEFISGVLPRYAAPVFLRIQPEAQVTGTFKLRKVDLQEQGYDPARVKDPVFFRDDAARSYQPLTPDHYRRLQSGEVSL